MGENIELKLLTQGVTYGTDALKTVDYISGHNIDMNHYLDQAVKKLPNQPDGISPSNIKFNAVFSQVKDCNLHTRAARAEPSSETSTILTIP